MTEPVRRACFAVQKVLQARDVALIDIVCDPPVCLRPEQLNGRFKGGCAGAHRFNITPCADGLSVRIQNIEPIFDVGLPVIRKHHVVGMWLAVCACTPEARQCLREVIKTALAHLLLRQVSRGDGWRAACKR